MNLVLKLFKQDKQSPCLAPWENDERNIDLEKLEPWMDRKLFKDYFDKKLENKNEQEQKVSFLYAAPLEEKIGTRRTNLRR